VVSGALAVTMSAGALALVLWPAVPGRWRLDRPAAVRRVVRRTSPGRMSFRRIAALGRHPRAGPMLAATGAGLLGLLVSWPGAVAAALLGATGYTLARRSVLRARRHRELAAAAAALDALGREVESGAAPSEALLAVAESAPARMAAVLRALAGGARPASHVSPSPGTRAPGADGVAGSRRPDRWVGRGRRHARAVAQSARDDVWANEIGPGLLAGWSLCRRHGIPLAAVVRAVAGDAHDRRRAAQQRAAQVAGPVVSGYVLSALPAAGLLLGSGMGADPLAVLTGSAWGGALLIAGTLLCCAGLLWTDRIVRR
jgi:tight adherence protein B